MGDENLLTDFVRADATADGVEILVREISWDGPGTPVDHWTVAATLPPASPEATIRAAMQAVLEDERYFRVCPECSQRLPNGLMLESYGQSCGTNNHGIVF